VLIIPSRANLGYTVAQATVHEKVGSMGTPEYQEVYEIGSDTYGVATITVRLKVKEGSTYAVWFNSRTKRNAPRQKDTLDRLLGSRHGSNLIVTNPRKQLREVLGRALEGSPFTVIG
jgi:hypothetical protein